MRLATVEQAFRIDAESQKAGVSGETLMEAAGAASAREIRARYPGARVAVVAGPGNNGGDARVVARLLGVEVNGSLTDVDVIVDGLFGIGFRDTPAGEYRERICAMNAAGRPIVALDVPSGLDAATGVARGEVVRATETLTFGLAKTGFFVNDGPGCVGRLRVLPIGFPEDIVRANAHTHFLFTLKRARALLPAREDSSNKSSHGRLLVCAGSEAAWGAGLLTATSAFRAGCGYVTWASFTKPPIADLPDAFTVAINDKLFEKKFDAVAVGPGLGTGRETADLIERLKQMDVPVVLDADGIEACRRHDLFPLPAHWVMTPHAGELGRVLGREARAIEADRFTAARDGVERIGCHVLLKGFRTVLASRARFWIIDSGNAALAKAGTGDALTGFIGSLMAQGLAPLEAAATGAYLHGRLADEWVRSGRDKATLLASDLRDLFPRLLARVRA